RQTLASTCPGAILRTGFTSIEEDDRHCAALDDVGELMAVRELERDAFRLSPGMSEIVDAGHPLIAEQLVAALDGDRAFAQLVHRVASTLQRFANISDMAHTLGGGMV